MLVLTVLATLVKYTTDETEVRILYEYLAEASVVFPKVTTIRLFPVFILNSRFSPSSIPYLMRRLQMFLASAMTRQSWQLFRLITSDIHCMFIYYTCVFWALVLPQKNFCSISNMLHTKVLIFSIAVDHWEHDQLRGHKSATASFPSGKLDSHQRLKS